MGSLTKALWDKLPSPSLPWSRERTERPCWVWILASPVLEARAPRQGTWDAPQEKADFLRPRSGDGRVGKLQSGGSHCSFFSSWPWKYQDLCGQVIVRMPAEVLEAAAQVSITGLPQRKSKCQGNCLLLDLGNECLPRNLFPDFPGLTETGYFKRINWLITLGGRKVAWEKHTDIVVSKSIPKLTNKKQCHTKTGSPHSLLRKQYFKHHHMKLLY